MDDLVVSAVAGTVQGLLEWVPVSSEGNLALALTLLGDVPPVAAVRLSLFLHAGTGLAALAYYRSEVATLVGRLPAWRPGRALTAGQRELTILGLATLVSALVGGLAYLALAAVASTLTGGAFVALVGALLVATGLLQRYATDLGLGDRREAGLVDALLLGIAQGVAVLPGISRSGTTVSALLLRGHEGRRAFDLSFLVSVPAAFGAGVLAVADAGGLPGVSAEAAVVALAASAIVGYLAIDALLSLVDRLAVWLLCMALGGLAIAGGLLVAV